MANLNDESPSRTMNDEQVEMLNIYRQRQVSGFRTQYLTNLNDESRQSQIFLADDDMGRLHRKSTSLS